MILRAVKGRFRPWVCFGRSLEAWVWTAVSESGHFEVLNHGLEGRKDHLVWAYFGHSFLGLNLDWEVQKWSV